MDAKPGPRAHGSAPGPGEAAVERYGPLAVRRLVKDDGRALIVYERVEPSEGDGPAGK
jgi:hypothetical protein